MNTKYITTMLLCAGSIAIAAQAQDGKEKFPERAKRQPPLRQRMMMNRFDKNRDGKLDEAEKAAMEKNKKEFMEKFDKDGDGKLNEVERKAFMEQRRKDMAPDADGLPGNMAPDERKKVLAEFDKDGDGKLDLEERKAAFKARRERMEQMRAEDDPRVQRRPPREKREMMIEKFDADRDGKLNEAERAKMREEIQKRIRGKGDNKE